LNTVLSGLGVKQPIVHSLKPEGRGTSAIVASGEKNWEWYQKNDVKALESMPVNDPETFKALYKAEFGCDPTM